MSVFQDFSNWIKTSLQDKPEVAENETKEITVLTEESPTSEFVETSYEQVEELPDWLSDEDLLRDEGVIFGLSRSTAEEKIAIIKTVFLRQTAVVEKSIQLLSEKIGEINLSIEQCENNLEKHQNRREAIEQSEKVSHNLLRTSLTILIAILMFVGNYFLIDTVVQKVFIETHYFISAGVFLAGLFSVFSPVSFLFEGKAEKPIFRVVEEIGIPFFAAFFVFSLAYDQMPVLQSFAVSMFVFFLFLFSGKIFLQQLSTFKSDFSAFQKNRSITKDKSFTNSSLKDDITELENEIIAYRKDKWKIIPELNRLESQHNVLNAKRDSLIYVFESEFKLARSYRGNLSQVEIKGIIE